jgi:hypothetical protein
MTLFNPEPNKSGSQNEQTVTPNQEIDLKEFRENQTQPWDKRLEAAFTNYDQLIPTLESFTQEEWDKYITCICSDKLPFWYERGNGGNYLSVLLTQDLKKASQESKEKIGKSIAEIIKQLLGDNLSEEKLQECREAFFISSELSIEIKDKDLLKNIIESSNFAKEWKTKACRHLITWADTNKDIEEWKEKINSENGDFILRMVFESISENSPSQAIELLNKFSDKIDVEGMKGAIYRFIKQLIENGQVKDFNLQSFPESLHDHIKNLMKLEQFQSLRDIWGIKETNQLETQI